MGTPQFILDLREKIGHLVLWIPGSTMVVVRPADPDLRSQWDNDEVRGDFTQRLLAGDVDRSDAEILIVQRADNGQYTPVTGIVDPGEEVATAGMREVKEEAAVDSIPLRLISSEVVGPVIYDNGDETTYLDTAFLMLWTGGEPYPADGENTSAQFIRADQLPELNARFSRVVERALSGNPSAYFQL